MADGRAKPVGPARPRELVVKAIRSVGVLDEASLEGLTRSKSVFFDLRWFRMLESINLGEILRARTSLRYMVVLEGSRVLALCPFLVDGCNDLPLVYSFDKLYFEKWQADLRRINPRMEKLVPWLARLTTSVRRAVRPLGVRTDAWMVVTSPLSYRADIAIDSELTSVERTRVLHAMIDGLKDFARTNGLSIWFTRVSKDASDLRAALRENGFAESFMIYDSVLPDLGGGVGDYLARFRGHDRKNYRRQMRRATESGVVFTREAVTRSLAVDMTRLYEQTYSKYGDEYFRYSSDFWPALQQHLGDHVEITIARRDGGPPLGFQVMLHKGDESHAFLVGKDPSEEHGRAFLYFNLAFYEPIRLAASAGSTRMWLGLGAWRTKRLRGAALYPLFTYTWSPGRLAHGLLSRYMQTFGAVARQQILASLDGTSLKTVRDAV